MSKKIHIVSFSIPYPANYGGVIDVFFKLKSLSEAGVKVFLHCFQYDREPAKELEQYCEKVFYYPRKMKGVHLLGFCPYIVSTRKSEALISNLLMNDAPILFEGLHTCYSIRDKRIKHRRKIVRAHNIEHDYYAALGKVEKRFIKRLFFKSESKKLKRFEAIAFKSANLVLGISNKDTKYLNREYDNAKTITAFHQFNKVNIPNKTRDYALYHGNLSVGENNEAALFLADKVFRGINYKLVIAGNRPSVKLKSLVQELDNVDLKEELTTSEINNLIHLAHINILPTFQSTGIKLKLLAALFNGGFCLVNNEMVAGTGVENFVELATTSTEFQNKIHELSQKSISLEENKRREAALVQFSNEVNLKKLLEYIF